MASSGLYGARDPSKQKHKPISSSSSLAFSSNLSSLISTAKSGNGGASATSKDHASSSKSSIFTAHNKNVKKRALADEQAGQQQQQHKTSAVSGRASESELHRSKRKMLEKARLYDAMKRGEYLDRSENDRYGGGLVDFDRKWAAAQKGGEEDNDKEGTESSSGVDSESDQGEGSADSTVEKIQWTDEFGRLITGTKKQHAHFERRQRIAAAAEVAFADASARPTQPSQIIYGDTIQTAAFNPETVIQDRMAELAAKRDKEATPPPDTHYDGEAEIRSKGTGFYGFSKDEEERKREMEGLERERSETEKKRQERREKLEARKREVEERREMVRNKRKERAEKEVDSFLDGLAGEIEVREPVRVDSGQVEGDVGG